jgi:hypothetical protein
MCVCTFLQYVKTWNLQVAYENETYSEKQITPLVFNLCKLKGIFIALFYHLTYFYAVFSQLKYNVVSKLLQ